MSKWLGYLQRMWAHTDVCGPVARNVGPFGNNVGSERGVFAANVGRAKVIFVGPRDYVCGPLQIPDGPQNTLLTARFNHLVITRDGATAGVVVYVNSIKQGSFFDFLGKMVFSGPNNIIHFFRSHAPGNSYEPSGFVDRIRIYKGALTQTEISDLFNGGIPPGFDARCNGKRATIVGTEEDDVLIGSEGDDIIAGLGGNDVIYGYGGDDMICGDDGNDVLIGGEGTDRLLGQGGNDILMGGGGRDQLNGGPGDDICDGGAGPTDTATQCEVTAHMP